LQREAVEAGKSEAIDAIVRRWAQVRQRIAEQYPDGSEDKALYGLPDNYPPYHYDRIYRGTASVVAIGAPGETTAFCSGTVVAENLVLTAAHCFARKTKGTANS
jgi:hypothetical protein